MRASDSDRDHVVGILQEQTRYGRLTVDEFSERLDMACAARTTGELRQVTADLPVALAFPGSGHAVRVDGLKVRAGYGFRSVLDGLSLNLGPGIHGLLGPPGAGKTALLRTLAGLTRPRAGSIQLLGHDVTRRDHPAALLQRLGYLPQTMRYYPAFSVWQFVEYIAWLKQMPPRNVPDAVDRAIAQVGLADNATAPMKHLPAGMLRLAGIAQAIVNDPDLLLLDEPAHGLEPQQRHDLNQLLIELATTATVMITSRATDQIAPACTDLIALHHGQITFRGDPEELYERRTTIT